MGYLDAYQKSKAAKIIGGKVFEHPAGLRVTFGSIPAKKNHPETPITVFISELSGENPDELFQVVVHNQPERLTPVLLETTTAFDDAVKLLDRLTGTSRS